MLVTLIFLSVMAIAPLGVPGAGRPQAPTLVVSCSAQPNTVAPGGDVAIAAQGTSAQNRHMSYSFTATSGRISANSASTAVLHTLPGSPATITVTCHAVDDRGAEASQTVTVTVRQP